MARESQWSAPSELHWGEPIKMEHLYYAYDQLCDKIEKLKKRLVVTHRDGSTEPLVATEHGDILVERYIPNPFGSLQQAGGALIKNAFSEELKTFVMKTRAEISRLRTSRDALGDIINSLTGADGVRKETYARRPGHDDPMTERETEFNFYWDNEMRERAVERDRHNLALPHVDDMTAREQYEDANEKPFTKHWKKQVWCQKIII